MDNLSVFFGGKDKVWRHELDKNLIKKALKEGNGLVNLKIQD